MSECRNCICLDACTRQIAELQLQVKELREAFKESRAREDAMRDKLIKNIEAHKRRRQK